ncbi:hypothetical protein ABE501_18510 [Comamonas testosteroni]
MSSNQDLVINEKINYHLQQGSTDQWAASAVVVERGVTYLVYDSIRIGNATDRVKGVSMQFILAGVPVAWTRVGGAEMTGVRHFSTKKIDGRIRIS